MADADVDMQGQPIDHAMTKTSEVIQQWAESAPDFGGMWVEPPGQDMHVAVAGPAAEEVGTDLQARVPSEVRLHAHQVTHSWAELQALHIAASEYLAQKGYRALYSVDSGAQVKTNDVRIRLKDTTPDDVLDDIHSKFPDAPMRIERTTSRWTAH